MNIFDRLESDVRSYCRHFPALFTRARGPHIYDVEGRQYIDFFSGAGSLNYGHNPPEMVRALVEYLEADGIALSLDMWTSAKARFLEAFETVVLKPRRLDYKVQFTGPTGANAVEAALKLTRKVTRRANVIAFSRSYHGLSAGALSITANSSFRHESFVNRLNVSFVPYDGYLGHGVDTMAYLRKVLSDRCSGVDLPAAIIVETVQADGGVNVASVEWLQQLEELCRAFEILLIVDDIQVGCGRTGPFFSFERAEIEPDIVLLSKSISGMGLPMSLLLMKPAVDQWKAGEHTGTFRGNNLAFVTATAALRFWESDALQSAVSRKGELLGEGLRRIAREAADMELPVRGLGLIYGLEMPNAGFAEHVSHTAFQHGLIVERCGPNDQVVKFLPPLVTDERVLQEGLAIIGHSVSTAFTARSARS